MRRADWLRVLAVTALLAGPCGSVNPPTAAKVTPLTPAASPVTSSDPSPVPTNSPTPMATPKPTPKATPKPAPNPCPPVKAPASTSTDRKLVLVSLRGSDCVVVRDISDINHPKTVSNLGLDLRPQFVSAAALSYVDARRGLLRTPLSGSPRTPIAGGGEGFFTWSPS